jgi:hypothetical protein
MDYYGKMMQVFDLSMAPQVRAMDDFIHDRPCRQSVAACVILNSNKGLPRGLAADKPGG